MADLKELADLAGIRGDYVDIWGETHVVPESTLSRLLQAFGLRTESGAERRRALHTLRDWRKRPLPRIKVVQCDRKASIRMENGLSWELLAEDQSLWHGKIVHGQIALPILPMGYYRLRVTLCEGECQSLVIAAPMRCWLPDRMDEETLHKRKRVWGVAAQLYSVRSPTNWGLGDFNDLACLVSQLARRHADVLGVNPLHAVFPTNLAHFSPYSPSSRLFLNFLYIDVTLVDGFLTHASTQDLFRNPAFQQELSTVRETRLVDYTAVGKLKLRILESLFVYFKQQNEQDAFVRFCEKQGEWLRQQALFDALSEHFAADWKTWPASYQDPHSQRTQDFARDRASRVEFYMWLQYVADAQLGRAQEKARALGMEIGIYRDLAVGPDKVGSETWLEPMRFLEGVSIGAPPDELNIHGQNWGLPAFNPMRLQEHHLLPFIELLRANMRHAGAIRLDHAFGLARLFLIPDGSGPEEGAYVTYPFDELLAVLRLESHLHQCVVIGEDLGTSPPDYPDKAATSGLLSYKVLYFSRDKDGEFIPPACYAMRALATLNTHDMPTAASWLQGDDIDEKEKLGFYRPRDGAEKSRADRKKDVSLLKQALVREDLKGQDTVRELLRYLARSPAAIVMIQAEDIAGSRGQANIPGTTIERPNWAIKMTESLQELDALLGPLAETLHEERRRPLMTPPRATYRLQFHKKFTFHEAEAIVPYLAELGISHVYASPYLKATPGSTHGYDIVDYGTLNPELGGESGYEAYTMALQRHGLGQILDFPPNHMGVGEVENKWWLSVLEWGQASPYASYFDIDWEPRPPENRGKLVLPRLADHYGNVLDSGDLRLLFDKQGGGFNVWYKDHRFPICPCDYSSIYPDMPSIAGDLSQGEKLKQWLAAERGKHASIDSAVNRINACPAKLHALLEQQHYRLAYWQVAAHDLNYRRFFDINSLAGLNVENPQLFEAMHGLVFSLLRQGKLQGLRIDHIDGLAEPAKYCRRLRDKIGAQSYLIVEKILEPHESLRKDWAINGTTGYGALNTIGALFVDKRNANAMDLIYKKFTGLETSFTQILHEAKRLILTADLASELHSLSLSLKRLADGDRYTRDYPLEALKQALTDLISEFPVYRTYITPEEASEADRTLIEQAVNNAKEHSTLPDASTYDFIGEILSLEEGEIDPGQGDVIRRFQQLTGPVMAKGMEDTSFYRFNRLLSLNEVGGDPSRFGLSVEEFHDIILKQTEWWPHSMLATATHDTKRGEDARARISVLSEMPEVWEDMLKRWTTLNEACCLSLDGQVVPSRNEQYFIYQTLLGSWPNELMQTPGDAALLQAYHARLVALMTKALREAKQTSNWVSPDERYESMAHNFVQAILQNAAFIEDFLPVARRIAQWGMLGSLGQLVLKLTLPGVPDIYQGTERWDLSLVDPDNRRPVDYLARREALTDQESVSSLIQHWADGKVKQRCLQQLLAHRRRQADLYLYGDYKPLFLEGRCADHAIAFSRNHNGRRLIVVVPRLLSSFAPENCPPWGKSWEDTRLILSESGSYCHVLSDETIEIDQPLSLAVLLASMPIAVLAKQNE